MGGVENMSKWFLLIVVLLPAYAFAQDGRSPYASETKREIKSLSLEERMAYERGEGMGLAKAAELNHYPGPKHVLDIAPRISLTAAQITETQRIYEEMHLSAVRLGTMIVDKERNLDTLFADNAADPRGLEVAVKEIARLQGELRFVHLETHLKLKRILTPAQIARYDELRGYSGYKGQGGAGARHEHRHGRY